MSLFFVALNLMTSGNFWAIWPIMGWGIGVAMQGLSLYGPLKDPDDIHPTAAEEEAEFSGPLPDLRDRPQKVRLKELDERGYSEEDLV